MNPQSEFKKGHVIRRGDQTGRVVVPTVKAGSDNLELLRP